MKRIQLTPFVWLLLCPIAVLAQVSDPGYLDKNWKEVATQMPTEWYGTDEAKLVAENILLSQKEIGGWAKNKAYHRPFSETEKARYVQDKAKVGATFDNDATTTELRFLAKVYAQFKDDRYKQAFEKGLNYIFVAQYENGGWPQFFPVRQGNGPHYSRHITYNDNAMINILQFLQEIIEGNSTFAALQINAKHKVKAQKAVEKGIDCILKTQIVVDGTPTVWCAQHDALTLAPAKARSYELASFSGAESAKIVQFLMNLEHPSQDIIASVQGAVKWFEANKIEGIRLAEVVDKNGKKDRIVVKDKDAPPMWGRFHDLETHKAYFCSRDGIKKHTLAEISHERRNGYGWYTKAPQDVLKRYSEWKAKLHSKNLEKPRIINTTDLGADPDDEQSMVRQLVSANEFDIEGLIVATGCWKKSQHNTDMLDKIVDAYAKAYPNLKVHAEGFPTPEYLRSISVMGQTGYGMGDVGIGKDSPGSDLIIASVDKDDPRPVWVMGWGGMNTVAQAIWKVQETRSKLERTKFLRKLRLFDILGQDDAGAWIAKNFPNVFYIRATGVYGWQPSDEYLDTHIQNHGSLGEVYPNRKWATEGDSPAFMHVYPNGLNDPDQIDQGGWGGRFSFTQKAGIRSMSEVAKINKEAEPQHDPYYMYGNTSEEAKAIKRWSKGYDNDFAARMDWSITNNYADANHHPIAVLNGDTSKKVLEINAPAGSGLELSAVGSNDPDGDSLRYTWYFYDEPSSYDGSVTIHNSSSSSPRVEIPVGAVGKTLHIILEIHDDGTPNLYAYRRVIVKVQP